MQEHYGQWTSLMATIDAIGQMTDRAAATAEQAIAKTREAIDRASSSE